MSETAVLPEPARRATELGHTMENDPPFASSASRWTCTRCGAAVLHNGGHVYGTAVEETCDQVRQADHG